LRFAPLPHQPVKKERAKREKIKADPAHIAAARELRDRYLEQFNAGLVLPNAKYHVCKALANVSTPWLLEQAA
jgi:hypothetical protein